MIKDEQDFPYIGGGDSRPLRIWSDFSSVQLKTWTLSFVDDIHCNFHLYTESFFFEKILYTQKGKNSILYT